VKDLLEQARAELTQLRLPQNLDLLARQNLATAACQLRKAGQLLRAQNPVTSLIKKVTRSESAS
jgi:hypothetical protein